MMQRYFYFLLPCFLLGCCGCSDNLKTVSGKITYDDKPLETGRISFIADNGAGTTYLGNCTNGKYSIRVPEGEFLVRIISIKQEKLETPIDIGMGSQVTERTVHLLPNTYGLGSRLKVSVEASTKTHDFLLEKAEDTASPFSKPGTQ
jgi:hypothetical protein